MFSRDGGVCTIHFEFVVENIKNAYADAPALAQKSARVEPRHGANILVHDGRAHVLLVSSFPNYVFSWLPWTVPQMCFHHFRILDLRFVRKRQPQHDEALRCNQPAEDPTVEPPPSEKHCKREVLGIVSLQMIFRDTPFLQYQADRQSVILGSDCV